MFIFFNRQKESSIKTLPIFNRILKVLRDEWQNTLSCFYLDIRAKKILNI